VRPILGKARDSSSKLLQLRFSSLYCRLIKGGRGKGRGIAVYVVRNSRDPRGHALVDCWRVSKLYVLQFVSLCAVG
jgi:hypothetical protein